MARIENNRKQKTVQASSYMVKRIAEIQDGFQKMDEIDEELLPRGFDTSKITSYKNEIKQEMKESFDKLGSMYQWIAGENQITISPKFTDDQVDAEDEEIRTHDVPE